MIWLVLEILIVFGLFWKWSLFNYGSLLILIVLGGGFSGVFVSSFGSGYRFSGAAFDDFFFF